MTRGVIQNLPIHLYLKLIRGSSHIPLYIIIILIGNVPLRTRIITIIAWATAQRVVQTNANRLSLSFVMIIWPFFVYGLSDYPPMLFFFLTRGFFGLNFVVIGNGYYVFMDFYLIRNPERKYIFNYSQLKELLVYSK